MDREYTLQELKWTALEKGEQFVHIVKTGRSLVMLIGESETRIFTIGPGGAIINPAEPLYLEDTVPTTFRFAGPHF